jgi:ABC-type uncharacterized transport system permease subunit
MSVPSPLALPFHLLAARSEVIELGRVLISLVFLGIAGLVWRAGVRHYQSTGS